MNWTFIDGESKPIIRAKSKDHGEVRVSYDHLFNRFMVSYNHDRPWYASAHLPYFFLPNLEALNKQMGEWGLSMLADADIERLKG